MTYFQNLNRLILKELELRAIQFAESYDEDKKSVILIPGGMGSKLLQCEAQFQPDHPFPPNPAFREIWVSLAAIMSGDISQLRMDPNQHDWDDHPIIAAGEMNTVVKSYDKTEKFFLGKNVNYTEFGFDWRREMRAAAGYLKTFLRMIKEKVMARDSHFENPLSNLTLFAHSMGGLVSKLLINELIDDNEATGDWFYRFVTVATPFFGTENHIERYYRGVKFINFILSGADKVASLVGTMPGPYCLMPAPLNVIEPRFERLHLNRYPVRDGSDTNSDADPFNIDNRKRFPPNMDENFFFKAEDIFQQVHRPLPDNVKERTFHLRNNLPDREEKNLELLWDNVKGSEHKFSGPSPISNNNGASDGTVPWWSARLADTPDNHVYPLQTDTDHGSLAEDPDTLRVVNHLVHGEDLPEPGTAPAQPRPALADEIEIENFIKEFQGVEMDDNSLETVSAPILRGLIKGLDDNIDRFLKILNRYKGNRKIIVASIHSKILKKFRAISADAFITNLTLGEQMGLVHGDISLENRVLETSYFPLFSISQIINKVNIAGSSTYLFLTGFGPIPSIDTDPDEKEIFKILNRGVDGIMTDRPKRIREIVEKWLKMKLGSDM